MTSIQWLFLDDMDPVGGDKGLSVWVSQWIIHSYGYRGYRNKRFFNGYFSEMRHPQWHVWPTNATSGGCSFWRQLISESLNQLFDSIKNIDLFWIKTSDCVYMCFVQNSVRIKTSLMLRDVQRLILQWICLNYFHQHNKATQSYPIKVKIPSIL